ncbi:MAG TPA: hypothetical protein IGS52_05500 [Oscillatoriaceae cyanobacterium M33_DOE_052]|nr:hypothetical protein [Oscillatoriaceae cyanobacterium M33_DOE_052]
MTEMGGRGDGETGRRGDGGTGRRGDGGPGDGETGVGAGSPWLPLDDRGQPLLNCPSKNITIEIGLL